MKVIPAKTWKNSVQERIPSGSTFVSFLVPGCSENPEIPAEPETGNPVPEVGLDRQSARVFIIRTNDRRQRLFSLFWTRSVFLLRQQKMGSGCGTAVEHMPHDIEVVGSNPAGCLAFFVLYIISSASLKRSLMEVQHYWFSLKMLSHAVWGEGSLICTDWAKKIIKSWSFFMRVSS